MSLCWGGSAEEVQMFYSRLWECEHAVQRQRASASTLALCWALCTRFWRNAAARSRVPRRSSSLQGDSHYFFFDATKRSSQVKSIFLKQETVVSNVRDLWHFGRDPDPRIRTSGSGIRVRILIRILLFLSVTFKMATIIFVFLKVFCLLLFKATFTSFFKDKKS